VVGARAGAEAGGGVTTSSSSEEEEGGALLSFTIDKRRFLKNKSYVEFCKDSHV
jgi:hypothetical protein